MEIGKEKFILCGEIIVTCYYGKQSFEGFVRGIFTLTRSTKSCSSTYSNENICYEIPSGILEKLLANPYGGDGTVHPDMHLIYVDEVCGLFKLAGLPRDEAKKKVFALSLGGKALTWYRLCDDIRARDWNRLKLEFHQKFYPIHLVHRDHISRRRKCRSSLGEA